MCDTSREAGRARLEEPSSELVISWLNWRHVGQTDHHGVDAAPGALRSLDFVHVDADDVGTKRLGWLGGFAEAPQPDVDGPFLAEPMTVRVVAFDAQAAIIAASHAIDIAP